MKLDLLHFACPLALLLGLGCRTPVVEIKGDDTQGGDDTAPPGDDTDSPIVDTGCPGEETPQTWYPDRDGDGYGAVSGEVESCDQPAGYVSDNTDCDDANETIYPNAEERCNSEDDDCDGTADEDFDADRDGHNSTACDGDDCDDDDNNTYPGAWEQCGDGEDQDCDGSDELCGYDVSSLSDANAKLYATGRSDDAGRHMDAGDIDGDGFEDAVVGEMWADGYQGGAFVVYGPVSGTTTFDAGSVEIKGGSGSYEGGRTVGVRDTNGDGFDDILLGAPDASGWDAVIAFGPIGSGMTFADADITTYCSVPVECGHGGDLADFDGDGVADAIIGAGEDNTGGYYSGSVYVIYGPLSAMSIDLRETHDVELIGQTVSSETGRVISANGDMNGDGVEDMIVTASYDSSGGPYAGAVHVVYGPVWSDMSLGDADGKLIGASAYDYAGEPTAMGDVDGDGLADAIIGAYLSSRGNGNVFIVSGPAAGSIGLSASDAIVKGASSAGLGTSMVARDVDGDGCGDLLAGAGEESSSRPGAGAAFLYFGPLAGTVNMTDAFATFYGEKGHDGAGYGVGMADMDANGMADLLIGATGESTGASAGGALYVVNSGS